MAFLAARASPATFVGIPCLSRGGDHAWPPVSWCCADFSPAFHWPLTLGGLRAGLRSLGQPGRLDNHLLGARRTALGLGESGARRAPALFKARSWLGDYSNGAYCDGARAIAEYSPDHPEVLLDLARCTDGAGRAERTVTLLVGALEIDPEHVDALAFFDAAGLVSGRRLRRGGCDARPAPAHVLRGRRTR